MKFANMLRMSSNLNIMNFGAYSAQTKQKYSLFTTTFADDIMLI